MLRLATVDLKRDAVKTLFVPVCEDKAIHSDPVVCGLVEKAMTIEAFRGKKDQELVLHNLSDPPIENAIFRGLGKAGQVSADSLRQASGRAAKRCIKMGVPRLWSAVPEAGALGIDPAVLLAALMEGILLGNHIFDRYKKEKENKPLARADFMVPADGARRFAALPPRIEAACRGAILAREWVNTPSNEKTPEAFAREVAAAAKKSGLTARVMVEAELRRRNFGALLAVSAGSRHRPALVVLEHKPRRGKETVVLVGKGVTFDSGGINIKTGPSIADMKSDMAGAAAVAAVLLSAAALKLDRRIVGVIPLVENMVSGDATRPGDIVTSFSGKTVEIGNTDAEGRLILADALAWALKTYAPQVAIDVATLTGACVVALGEEIAGLFTADEALKEEILAASARTHERCWPLPLPEDYKELLKSSFADINNMPSAREGGAISAALFLSEFTAGTRWAHIDIAGPAYHKKESAICGPGGTGFGVRLLLDWLLHISPRFG
ncbi:MAG: leucyl aminopeptidase [Desulfobacterales bacterium]|jgi:leucyl aminopeptidase|nr:leucyl aminopeptidase [Desulfobacterales bacterium]